MALKLILVLLMVVFTTIKDSYALYSGELKTYYVEDHGGSIYNWVIYNNTDLTSIATSSEVLIVEGENTDSITVRWINPGTYYLVVNETDFSGCSNTKAVIVQVSENETDWPVVVFANPTVNINGFNYILGSSCEPLVLDASQSTGEQLSYLWEPSDYLDNSQSSTTIFTPGTTTKYKLTITDMYGHSTTDSIGVWVTEKAIAYAGENLYIQYNQSGILDGSGSSGDNLSYMWETETGNIVDGNNSSMAIVDQPGKYYLTVTDQYGCADKDSVIVGMYIQALNDTISTLVSSVVSINVLANDIPQEELNPSSLIIKIPPNNGVAFVSSDSIVTYTPDQYYVGQDNFIYEVCDFNNECDNANVLVIISDEDLFIPTAFSPNGDGINDYFEIKGIAGYKKVSLKIFNRWGNAVYESENYGSGSGKSGFWDGVANKGIRTGNGQVPTGTYFYVLDLGQGYESLSGFIYIDR